jgi:alkanesulfonate monooxygenase SsuD/methylene tetrahydromethanopterin reductase-like flavin-dependent oxidoreductase (luciferase family)
LLLKPASPTPPEIYSVSTSDRGRDFIADYCDWWFVEMPKETTSTDEALRLVEGSVADMKKRMEQRGRKVRFAINPFLALGDSAEQALDATVRRILEFDPDPDTRKIERRMLPATRAGCMGRPRDVLTQIRRFEAMGIELLLLKLIPTVENVEDIGRRIIAELRAPAPA